MKDHPLFGMGEEWPPGWKWSSNQGGI